VGTALLKPFWEKTQSNAIILNLINSYTFDLCEKY